MSSKRNLKKEKCSRCHKKKRCHKYESSSSSEEEHNQCPHPEPEPHHDCFKCLEQIIYSAGEKINPEATMVMFDRRDWYLQTSTFNVRCAVYELPEEAHHCQRMTLMNHHDSINILVAKQIYGEFIRIFLLHEGDSVILEWSEGSSLTPAGWFIISTAGNPMVENLHDHPTYLYCICPVRRMDNEVEGLTDFLATIDINPTSPTYGTIVDKAFGTSSGEADPSIEFHHGDICHVGDEYYVAAGGLRWNTSSTPEGGSPIDFFNLSSRRHPNKSATAASTLLSNAGACSLHTVHQDPYTGDVLVSYFGTPGTGVSGPAYGPGGIVQISSDLLFPSADLTVRNFHTIGASNPGEIGTSTLGVNDDNWQYDFVINACEGTLVSTSWGPPSSFENGFNPALPYGRSVRVYDMPPIGGPTNYGSALSLLKLFTLDPIPQMGGSTEGEGVVPLEVRRLHDPESQIYFISVTLPGAVDLVWFDGAVWQKKVAVTPSQLAADCATVNGVTPSLVPGAPVWSDPFGLGSFPVPLVTDITLSADDKYLYVSCWLAGCVLQYNVSDPFNVIFSGGVGNLGGITTIAPFTNVFNTNSISIKGIQYVGGPQMLRLSRDGQKLYVTNSLFSAWDDEFYPPGAGSIKTNGGKMIKIKTGIYRGNKIAPPSLDTNFMIDFQNLTDQHINNGTTPFTSRAHECHIVGVTH